jgi:anti-sigma regulatory factor (Ser/Thr protein kinase)
VKRRRTFPGDPASVGQARHYVHQVVDGRVPSSTAEVAALMVSELATNCVRHAHTGFSVEVDVGRPRLVVRITDAGPGTPLVRHTRPQTPSGRGLRVVEEMSDEWGVEPAGSGKTVWFGLDLRAKAH